MGEMTFGERLRAIRQGQLVRGGPEIGVRELARCTGISNTALSEAENGKGWVGKLPSLEILEALARCLEVSIPDLVGRPVEGMPNGGTSSRVGGDREGEGGKMTEAGAYDEFAADLRRRHPSIAAKLEELRREMDPSDWDGLMEKLPEAIAGQLDVTLDGYLSGYRTVNRGP